MTDVAAWPHIFEPGIGNGPVLLMLHGTGSNERDILELGTTLSTTAALLAPRGAVTENGMLRWFRRIAEGQFDVDSVTTEAQRLSDFIIWARQQYDLTERPLIAVGFSNGANIALATGVLHPDVVNRVIAFSGMYPLAERDIERTLNGVEVLLLNGASDPMAPSASVDRLESQLRQQGATVTRRTRAGGHGVDRSEVDAASSWIRERSAE